MLFCLNKSPCFFLMRTFFSLARSFLLEKFLTQTTQFILNGLMGCLAWISGLGFLESTQNQHQWKISILVRITQTHGWGD